TYINQFINRLSKENASDPMYNIWFQDDQKVQGRSSFFLMDAQIGFRMPSRRGLLSFEAKNILDESFYFRNPYFFISEPVAPRYTPTRSFFVRLTLNF
ncbi:MAG: hypothetical protein KGN35_08280, partial [Betaproteobacteria bacterium]|nr:hypothetical protein [Betaproteobacteria bacterium]